MNRLWEWCRSWLAVRKVSASERAASRLAARIETSLRKLGRQHRKLEALESRIKSLLESVTVDLERTDSLQRQYEETMEMLRSENRIQREVMIPLLVSYHKLALERCDADIAIQTRRRVAMATREDSIGEQ